MTFSVVLSFKVAQDPFMGLLCFTRFIRKISPGNIIFNSNSKEKIRLNKILQMHADKRVEVQSAGAGDIVALVGLKKCIDRTNSVQRISQNHL